MNLALRSFVWAGQPPIERSGYQIAGTRRERVMAL
jgi:hypothetical protein